MAGENEYFSAEGGVPVDDTKMNSRAAYPAGTRATSKDGRPAAPRCVTDRSRTPAKCVIRWTGRNVAKLNSRRTAKMAVASKDVAIVVQGSVRIDLFLTLPLAAEAGL